MTGRGWTAGLVSAVVATLTVVVMAAGCSGDNGGTTDSGTDGTANQCGASGTLCSGSCVNTQTDNANCGTCGTACGAGEVCSQGKCATSCGGGTKLCGSICADTKNDPQNCGDCSTKCGTGQVCSNGNCGTTCTTGQTFCGGDSGAPYCANTKTDNANCGGCGTTCGTGQVCNNGTCANSCGGDDAGTDTLCTPDGGTPYCANTKTDNANCGGCGTTCGNGKVCQNGACANDCASSDGGVETFCAPDGGPSYCADTSSDNTNCGACGTVCGFGTTCVGGSCQTIVPIKVAVEGGSYYTDGIRAYLATQPGIGSATQITACDTTTLGGYDVVIVYGNMTCFSDANYTSYVNSGGGLIGTPWVFGNNGGIVALPVTAGGNRDTEPGATLNITVTDSTDPLLAGVVFNNTDTVGYEGYAYTLNTGATQSAYWNDGQTSTATAKWSYGSGRAVYLNFHYITSDSNPASGLPWAQRLMYNAVLWAAKRQ